MLSIIKATRTEMLRDKLLKQLLLMQTAAEQMLTWPLVKCKFMLKAEVTLR